MQLIHQERRPEPSRAGADGIRSAPNSVSMTYPPLKRVFDVAVALTAGILLLPVFVVIAVVIKMTSRGPVLHWSKRVGIGNGTFMMAKFRTMRVETPQLATHLMTDPESFATPAGRLLRKLSFDELPQLINILRGDISFVGPRPALYNQHDLVALRTHRGVHTVIPGLTGWAQVNGRDELPIRAKVDHDAYYLHHRSFTLDLRILFLTVFSVARLRGVAH